MALTEHETGSQLAVVATEHTLNTTSPDGTNAVYQFWLDCSGMLSGDELIIRIYEKVRSSDTQVLVYDDTLSGAQSAPAWVSPSLLLLHGWDFTIEQTTGTGRSYPWSVRAV